MPEFQLDLFSKTFQFKFKGREVGKKTSMGTITSILVILLSLVYFAYLIYTWIAGDMTPKVVVQTNAITSLEFKLEQSPIMLRYWTAGENIQFNQYFDYEAEFSEGNDEEKTGSTEIPMAKCDTITGQFNSTYSDSDKYVCVNPVGNDVVLYVDDTGATNYLSVAQQACSEDSSGQSITGAACVDFQNTIKPLMEQPFFKVEVMLSYYEFDIKTNSMNQRFKKIEIPGDYTNVGLYTFYVEVSKIKVDNGWLWPVYTEFFYISGYNTDLQVLDSAFMRKKVGGQDYQRYFSIFNFELQLKQIETLVEYPKISEIFAQYSAMFSTLLLLGIIAQFNSEAQIYQEMSDVYLKEYYKVTAEQLVKHDTYQQTLKHQNSGLKKLPSQEQMLKDASNSRNREFKTLWRVFVPQNNKSNNKVYDPQNIDPDRIYKVAIDKSIQNMSVSHLFTEIYQLKTAIQAILTPQQYAALFYVGRSIPDDYIMRENRNQLEENDYIEEDVLIREKYLQEFLNNNDDQSQISQALKGALLESVKQGNFQNRFFQKKGYHQGPHKTIKEQDIKIADLGDDQDEKNKFQKSSTRVQNIEGDGLEQEEQK